MKPTTTINMKLMKILTAAAMALALTACGSKAKTETAPDSTAKEQKTLVAYFSATGTTASVAKRLASFKGNNIVEIKPDTAYTVADLDWHNDKSRSSVEMHDPAARPVISVALDSIGTYDVVYIGYPIWWDLAPRQINTFIEKYDLKGKKIVPFATSGGSTIDNSVKVLRETYPDLDIADGHLIDPHATDNELLEILSTNL